MEDLVRLLPRKLVVLVVAPFLLGVVGLAVLIEPSPVGQTLLYLVAIGGGIVFLVLGVGLSLLVKQSRGIDSADEE